MMPRFMFLLASSGLMFGQASAFQLYHVQSAPFIGSSKPHVAGAFTAMYAAADDSTNEDLEDPNEEKTRFSLPPIGASSFWERPTEGDGSNASDSADLARNDSKDNRIIISKHTNLVSPKFQLQYTCKICSTRNSHSVTRLAYRKGVVIAVCKGCESKHLIADNLGWSNYIGGFDFDNGERNIEKYMENRDQEARENGTASDEGDNDLVMRVNQSVFDLENMLYKDEGDAMSFANDNDQGNQAGGGGDEMSWS